MTTGLKLSIVLPCYNEGATLTHLMDDYRAVFRSVPGVELILVDNGSTDETAQKLAEESKKENPFVFKTVTVPVNQGYGYGMMAGLKQTTGEYIAWSHADLQCHPQDVLRLYEAVIQRPEPKKCFGKARRVNDRGGAVIFTRLQTLLATMILGRRLDEVGAQPKLFHRDFLKEFGQAPSNYMLDIFAYYKAVRKKMDLVTIDVHFHKRQSGKSKWAYSIPSRLRFIWTNTLYLVQLRLLAR